MFYSCPVYRLCTTNSPCHLHTLQYLVVYRVLDRRSPVMYGNLVGGSLVVGKLPCKSILGPGTLYL